MTKDQITAWAREAGFSMHDGIITGGVTDLERFASLIAAAERNRTWTQEHWTEYERSIAAAAKAEENEACAKLCDEKVDAEYATGKVDHNEMGWTQACAIAIRARKENT